ncbi:E3 ubiquitin-protein ligase NEURL3 isoform 1-T1 [Menidia menidia]
MSRASPKTPKKSFAFCFKIMNKTSCKNFDSEMPHRCGLKCLGPLAFHHEVRGRKIKLTHGCRLAERPTVTFQNGLLFSNRTVKIQERISLMVQNNVPNWHGAIRVGFTNVPPSARTLPLPSIAIPNLTASPGHWAAPVDESECRAGSMLQFWVSAGGNIYMAANNRRKKLLSGVDLSQPLWAMIDLYGQTCAILLLGSEKRGLLCTRKSCPPPEPLSGPGVKNHPSFKLDVSTFGDDCISCLNMEIPTESDLSCVVCMVREASMALPCAHRCLCGHCYQRYRQEFNTCPLCRHSISSRRGSVSP